MRAPLWASRTAAAAAWLPSRLVMDGVLSLMRYYFRSSMTVLPIRIGIPGWSGVGVVSRCRSR
ncbi:hypothetical protein P3T37_004097 [Kitasatospora sp. MAA4]|nr:hypothetical protein [Kitasatospora sp. MAA4]